MDKNQIYKSIILDNSKKPNKFVDQIHPSYKSVNTDTTACSDNYKIYIDFKDFKITDILFQGDGCSISKSSINLFANYLIGKNIEQAKRFINNYKNMIKSKTHNKEELKDLIAFEGINKQLNRVACALTGPNAILKLLENYE